MPPTSEPQWPTGVARSLTPEERSQRARIAAYTRWAQDDGQSTGAAGQAGLIEKFRRQVLDEQGPIAEPELSRRADRLYRAHMSRLSFLASKARRAKAAGS